ncbi:MAG TPA: hypothetical protein VH593_05515 [Ktedonobacteraceae bacterium]
MTQTIARYIPFVGLLLVVYSVLVDFGSGMAQVVHKQHLDDPIDITLYCSPNMFWLIVVKVIVVALVSIGSQILVSRQMGQRKVGEICRMHLYKVRPRQQEVLA